MKTRNFQWAHMTSIDDNFEINDTISDNKMKIFFFDSKVFGCFEHKQNSESD